MDVAGKKQLKISTSIFKLKGLPEILKINGSKLVKKTIKPEYKDLGVFKKLYYCSRQFAMRLGSQESYDGVFKQFSMTNQKETHDLN